MALGLDGEDAARTNQDVVDIAAAERDAGERCFLPCEALLGVAVVELLIY